jgi:AraC-like DNA-binding protein
MADSPPVVPVAAKAEGDPADLPSAIAMIAELKKQLDAMKAEDSAEIGAAAEAAKALKSLPEAVRKQFEEREAVAKAETPPFRLIRAVDAWLEASMDPDIGDLAEKTGLSAAQLQRQLKATYGASPKLLARKYRALKTAVRIANGGGVWQDYVGDTYYDQSHCIREIKAFTGVTPEAIRKTPRLTKATFERHKLKGKISTLATEI